MADFPCFQEVVTAENDQGETNSVILLYLAKYPTVFWKENFTKAKEKYDLVVIGKLHRKSDPCNIFYYINVGWIETHSIIQISSDALNPRISVFVLLYTNLELWQETRTKLTKTFHEDE
ncbi:hypothetical protein Fcan01_25237 [Folsomia candida]|uniref:Uncharacterized protein n=1 Tax=Folsomia candida TaxID=158441 RepID=A0A226D5L6_FOLCA|nr:hypothetical protein Fcan01_25237 [Folsomia candida]